MHTTLMLLLLMVIYPSQASVDGVDIAARNGVLTTTTTTANAALPKAGGTMTGALNMNSNQIQNANLTGGSTYLPGHAYSNTHDGSNVYWHIGSASGSTNKTLNLRIYNSSNSYSTNTWTVDRLTVAGGVTTTGDIIAKGSSDIIIGTFSNTDTGSLYILLALQLINKLLSNAQMVICIWMELVATLCI